VTSHHSPRLTTRRARKASRAPGRWTAASQRACPPARSFVFFAWEPPVYGKAWGEVPPTANGCNQTGHAGQGRAGKTNFRDIKAKLENGRTGKARTRKAQTRRRKRGRQDCLSAVWDDTSKAPFLYKRREAASFISYEDEPSIGLKGSYVKGGFAAYVRGGQRRLRREDWGRIN